MKSLTSSIKLETDRINAIDSEIERLLQSRDLLTARLSQVENEIKNMDDFVDDFSQIASDPSIRIPANITDRMTPAQIPIRADGGVAEEKEDAESQLLAQTSENVVKPESDKLRAYEFYVIQSKPKFNYPRTKEDFIRNVNMPQMKKLLQLLGLNTTNTAIPDSPLITVELLYSQFLESNPKLMTSGKIQQYYFK